jgi:hypothetical protein
MSGWLRELSSPQPTRLALNLLLLIRHAPIRTDPALHRHASR